MGGLILVLSVFVLGAGAVVGAFVAFTKLPGMLQQRRLNTRLEVRRIIGVKAPI